MRQAVVPEPHRIIYREVPDPVLEAHQVILRVARIGICGSDVHVFEGNHPLVSFPLVQGHEFSGFIEQVGNRVSGFQSGDLVTVEPAIGCDVCAKCQAGLFAQCEKLLFIGGALPGGGSDLFAVDARYVVKLPLGVDADDAAMTEPLAVAVHSVRRLKGVQGKRVLVLGGGTIGNLTAQVARVMGASRVILVDKVPFRNNLAAQIGFMTINPTQVASVKDSALEMFDGEPPDAAFECVGKQAPLNTCIQAVMRGGEVVVVGVYDQDPSTRMILVQDKEINLAGSLMYTWEDYHTAVQFIQERRVDLKLLQTHHFPFERWLEAYNLLLEHPDQAVKVIVDIT
jgi:L-iditol 2-dehydrogenase